MAEEDDPIRQIQAPILLGIAGKPEPAGGLVVPAGGAADVEAGPPAVARAEGSGRDGVYSFGVSFWQRSEGGHMVHSVIRLAGRRPRKV